MKTELVIRDVRRTQSLEDYLSSHISDVVESMIPEHRNAVLRLRVSEDSHRTDFRRPHFECSVYLRVGKQRPIRITKQDSAFHVCVERVGTALRESLRRSHQKAAPLHRSNRYLSFEDSAQEEQEFQTA